MQGLVIIAAIAAMAGMPGKASAALPNDAEMPTGAYHLGDCDAAGEGTRGGEVDVLDCLDQAVKAQGSRLMDVLGKLPRMREVERRWDRFIAAQCDPVTLDVGHWGPTYRKQALLECKAVLTSDRASYFEKRVAVDNW